MTLFSFKALKKAYYQVQFEEKLNTIISEAVTDAEREIFLFAKDEKINDLLAELLKKVNQLVNKYKMNSKGNELVSYASEQFKSHVNRYIAENIQYLPTRSTAQPIRF